MVNYSYSKWYIAKCNLNGEKVNKKFVNWINSVEAQVYEVLCCDLLDLPDEQYFISFENNISSKEFANYIINENCHFVMNNAYKVYL